MYKQAYLRASEEADRLAEDPKKAARVAQREGIMSRISATVEDELSKPLSVDYISRMRRRVKEEGPKVEGGSVTGMATPDTGELPEGITRPKAKAAQGEITLGEGSTEVAKGYPVSQRELESVIIQEAKLRNIDPTVAVAIFRHEGAGAYQSQIKRSGKGSLGGKEASFGPFQLYTGGGLGNRYEKETGRDLTQDNSLEGLTKQIQFSLDAAVDSGWTPWYGRGPAGVSERQGLSEARVIGNWRD